MLDAGRFLALAVALTPAALAALLVRALSLPDRYSTAGRLVRVDALLGIALLAASSLLGVWTLWTATGRVVGPDLGAPGGPLGALDAFRPAARLALGGTGLVGLVLLTSLATAVAERSP